MEGDTPPKNQLEGSAARREPGESHASRASGPDSTWLATLSFSVSSEPFALSAARRSLEGLRELVEPQVFADLRLVISELVKNSLQHSDRGADSKISFEVSVSNKVRALVTDFGSGFDLWRMKPTTERDSGWGLFIVDRLADSWGVLHEQGTHVWLEIDYGRTSQGPDRP
jgi:anti-sigma regulatory factor (Ser/Thr protein kinase)